MSSCTSSKGIDMKKVLRLLPIRSTCLTYTIAWAKARTLFTKQVTTVDKSIGHSFQLPSASIRMFIPISNSVLHSHIWSSFHTNFKNCDKKSFRSIKFSKNKNRDGDIHLEHDYCSSSWEKKTWNCSKLWSHWCPKCKGSYELLVAGSSECFFFTSICVHPNGIAGVFLWSGAYWI